MKQITPRQLADKIDNNENFILIDVRSKESFEEWHIENARNIPYNPGIGLRDNQIKKIKNVSKDKPIIGICRKGLSSTKFGFELKKEADIEISVVKGGMEDWSDLYEFVNINTGIKNLEIVQIQRRAKGCLGYIVASNKTNRGIAIDVGWNTDQFKIVASQLGIQISKVLDTHIHADHISGSAKLAEKLNVPYFLSEKVKERDIKYKYTPLENNQIIELDDLEIKCIDMPGHTSDMMGFLIEDKILLTGDTLFIESVGRTELQFGEKGASKGAKMLYESIHNIILKLSNDTAILPGHISVTDNGRYKKKSPGQPIKAKIKDLKKDLDLLQVDKEKFIDKLTKNVSEKPRNYDKIIDINKGKKQIKKSEVLDLELGPNRCAAI